ncbi:MAG TPA: HAMP domain-containing sensor histidine kinase [Chromobacteriaceae bacterium]|nr:HAMP domain-containing sensor histidine kinase [Chromobacteriaceae bacterium]
MRQNVAVQRRVGNGKVADMMPSLPPLSPPRFAADLSRSVTLLGHLRSLMLLAGGGALLACWAWGVALPWGLLGQALLTLLLAHGGLSLWLRRGGPVRLILQLGLLLDVLTLTELLAFSGGAANPLASLYLPPVLLAALLSPGWFAWALAVLTLVLYGLLFAWHLPWPVAGHDAAYAFNLHLIGMWLTFALSALLIAGFVSWLARQLAEREAALAAARETQLREEQLLAVGMQAAGAAHSLSTPINTLTLLVDELASEHASVPGLGDDLALMRGQLSCCREALARLKHGSEPQQAAAPLFAMLAERLSGWRSLRPDVRLHWQPPQGDDPPVRLEAAFWPALFNLINNAADAGGGEVEVSGRLVEGELQLDIINREGCLTPQQLERAGLRPLASDKPAGMGLGVMLSHATLARLGGSLSLDNRPQGGVHARVSLPLTRE